MAELVYILCALTAVICAILLLRGYSQSRTPLVFWSSLCFIGLAINNGLLLLDLYVFPAVDLFLPRTLIALVAMLLLVFGLIWETR